MRTVRTKVYKFSELSKSAKEKAIDSLYYINVDDSYWYESTYEDANNIGIKITSFDIDRGSYCKGEFQLSPHEVAANIIRDHGEACKTNKTAQTFLDATNEIEIAEGYDYEDKMMQLEDDFLKSLCEDYLKILRNEYEYQTSKEAIIESIEANEYEFKKDGSRF